MCQWNKIEAGKGGGRDDPYEKEMEMEIGRRADSRLYKKCPLRAGAGHNPV
jgi:hypothetical protein